MRLPAELSVFALVVIGCSKSPAPLQHAQAVVLAEVGAAAKPQVAFMRDSTHLLVQLQGGDVAQAQDSAFAQRANRLARLALEAYGRGAGVESVTVSVGDMVAPGMAFRVLQSRTYASSTLQ